jgi:hypothetical protein
MITKYPSVPDRGRHGKGASRAMLKLTNEYTEAGSLQANGEVGPALNLGRHGAW